MASNRKTRRKPLYNPSFAYGPSALFYELSPADLAAQLVAAGNSGDDRARKWLSKFVSASLPKKGVVRTLHSDAALEELVDVAADANVTWHPRITERRAIVYVPSFGPLEGNGDVYATALLRVIEAGLLKRIRYCARHDCGKFFFGDVRARWCSSACGARQRQRQFYRQHSG